MIFRGVISVSFCLYFFRKFIVIFIELFVGVFSSRVRIFNVNILWVLNKVIFMNVNFYGMKYFLIKEFFRYVYIKF